MKGNFRPGEIPIERQYGEAQLPRLGHSGGSSRKGLRGTAQGVWKNDKWVFRKIHGARRAREDLEKLLPTRT